MKATEAIQKILASKLAPGSDGFTHYLHILMSEESIRVINMLTNNSEEKITLAISRTAEKQVTEWVRAICSEFKLQPDMRQFVWYFRKVLTRKFPKAHERITQELNRIKERKSKLFTRMA